MQKGFSGTKLHPEKEEKHNLELVYLRVAYLPKETTNFVLVIS